MLYPRSKSKSRPLKKIYKYYSVLHGIIPYLFKALKNGESFTWALTLTPIAAPKINQIRNLNIRIQKIGSDRFFFWQIVLFCRTYQWLNPSLLLQCIRKHQTPPFSRLLWTTVWLIPHFHAQNEVKRSSKCFDSIHSLLTFYFSSTWVLSRNKKYSNPVYQRSQHLFTKQITSLTCSNQNWITKKIFA